MEAIISISLIVGIAAILTIIARLFKQPPIIAYLIAGIVVGPLFLGLIGGQNSEIIQTFAGIGVAFLLFIIGLSLDFRVLKEVGGIASLGGLSTIIATGGFGFLIVLGLKFNITIALYLAAALAFSSTVVVVKILSDKKEMDTLHARIALGILIVEDFIAALILIIIPALQTGDFLIVLTMIGKIIGLIALIFLLSTFVLKRFMHYLAQHQETLFLFGIGWALVIAALFHYLGLSLEIGALIAGMSLASTKYTLELGGKIKPLRDFFVVLFFVFFGSQLVGPISWPLIKVSIILSAFILLGKPLIVMTVTRFFGYKKRTNFLASSCLAQISEFSLIIILIGFNLGHLTQEIMNIAILVALITIGLSSYTIHHSHRIFDSVSNFLNIFEGRKDESKVKGEKEYSAVLFGYHRLGFRIAETLKQMKIPFVVVDYNPKVVIALTEKGIDCIYGDASNKDFLNELRLDKAKLIISTLPDIESNLAIKEKLEESDSPATFIATSEQPRSALELYNNGADYVIVPHHLGGDYVSQMIKNFKTNPKKYKQAGRIHSKALKKKKNQSTFY